MNDNLPVTVHYLQDGDGTMQEALVSQDEKRHTVIAVSEYLSGTAMTGEAIELLARMKKRSRSAVLVLAGSRRIELPIPQKKRAA